MVTNRYSCLVCNLRDKRMGESHRAAANNSLRSWKYVATRLNPPCCLIRSSTIHEDTPSKCRASSETFQALVWIAGTVEKQGIEGILRSVAYKKIKLAYYFEIISQGVVYESSVSS